MGLLFLKQVLFASSDNPLGIAGLLLGLLVEVVGHPNHLFDEKVPVSLASLCWTDFMVNPEFVSLILKDVELLGLRLRTGNLYFESQIFFGLLLFLLNFVTWSVLGLLFLV